MSDAMGWNDPVTSRRWDLREITFTLVVSIVTLAVLGSILPAVTAVGVTAGVDAWTITLTLLAASAVPYVLSIPIAVYLVERRIPWPFGHRIKEHPHRPGYVERFVPVLAMLISWNLGRLWWPIEYDFEAADGTVIWVGVPAAAAQGVILGLGAYGIAFAIVSLWGRNRSVASSLVSTEPVGLRSDAQEL